MASVAPSAVPGIVPPRRWLTRVFIPAALLLGAAGVVAWSARHWLLPARAVAVQPVLVLAGDASGGGTAVPGATGLSEPVAQATGWLEPAPYPVFVAGLATGVIEKMHVLEGQAVKAGDPVADLVRLDAELALAAATAESKRAGAMVERAQAEKAAAQADWDSPTDRQRALALARAQKTGADAEAALLPEQVKAMEAERDALRDRMDRLEKLRGSGAFVEADWVQAHGQWSAKVAALAALRLEAPKRAAMVAAADAELASASQAFTLRIDEKKRLRQAEQEVAVAESEEHVAAVRRDEAALRLARMTVRAPMDGVVMRLLKAPGETVDMNSVMPRAAQVAMLYDPAHLQVRADVPQSLAARVKVGQPCEIVFDLLPDRKFKGRVARFVHEADTAKNTVQVKVDLLETAPELKPDILARVAFFPITGVGGVSGATGGGGAQRVYVPTQALVVRHETHGVVWVADPLGGSAATAREVDLKLGEAGPEGFVRVLGGLNPGDRVVLNPATDLKAGARLKIVDERP